MAKVLFIDNFDSFTYNLVDEFALLGHDVTVVRNNVPFSELTALVSNHELLVISPGPGSPCDAGHCSKLLDKLVGKIPVLGICLGHQLIIEQQGGTVDKAPLPVHGKFAHIDHSDTHCFAGLNNPMTVGRYHSLVAKHVPENFEILATVESLVMSVFDPNNRLLGFQFHPESILTIQGSRLLEKSVSLLLTHQPVNQQPVNQQDEYQQKESEETSR